MNERISAVLLVAHLIFLAVFVFFRFVYSVREGACLAGGIGIGMTIAYQLIKRWGLK